MFLFYQETFLFFCVHLHINPLSLATFAPYHLPSLPLPHFILSGWSHPHTHTHTHMHICLRAHTRTHAHTHTPSFYPVSSTFHRPTLPYFPVIRTIAINFCFLNLYQSHPLIYSVFKTFLFSRRGGESSCL